MFTMMNRVLETNQIETKTDFMKSKTEIHCTKPQIRDHPSKVPTSKDFKKSANFSTSSKMRILRSFQINHIKQAGTIFQTDK